MQNFLRKLIKEAIDNMLSEVQEGNRKIIEQLLSSVLNSEIYYKETIAETKQFSFDNRELKEEIKDKLLGSIREIQKKPHLALDTNKILNKPGFGNPIKDKSEFKYSVSDMYLYKLGTFKALENGDYKKVLFKTDSLRNILPSSQIFTIDSMFVVIFEDYFYDFGFYSSFDSDINLTKYMQSLYLKNVKQHKFKPSEYIISNDFNKEFKLYSGKEFKAVEQPVEKKNIKLNALKKDSLVFIPSFGWGQIESLKKPYMQIAFPKDRPNKIFTPERPVLDKLGKKEILTKEKFPAYLNKVGAEIKKFDATTLFTKAMQAKMEIKEDSEQ